MGTDFDRDGLAYKVSRTNNGNESSNDSSFLQSTLAATVLVGGIILNDTYHFVEGGINALNDLLKPVPEQITPSRIDNTHISPYVIQYDSDQTSEIIHVSKENTSNLKATVLAHNQQIVEGVLAGKNSNSQLASLQPLPGKTLSDSMEQLPDGNLGIIVSLFTSNDNRKAEIVKLLVFDAKGNYKPDENKVNIQTSSRLPRTPQEVQDRVTQLIDSGQNQEGKVDFLYRGDWENNGVGLDSKGQIKSYEAYISGEKLVNSPLIFQGQGYSNFRHDKQTDRFNADLEQDDKGRIQINLSYDKVRKVNGEIDQERSSTNIYVRNYQTPQGNEAASVVYTTDKDGKEVTRREFNQLPPNYESVGTAFVDGKIAETVNYKIVHAGEGVNLIRLKGIIDPQRLAIHFAMDNTDFDKRIEELNIEFAKQILASQNGFIVNQEDASNLKAPKLKVKVTDEVKEIYSKWLNSRANSGEVTVSYSTIDSKGDQQAFNPTPGNLVFPDGWSNS